LTFSNKTAKVKQKGGIMRYPNYFEVRSQMEDDRVIQLVWDAVQRFSPSFFAVIYSRVQGFLRSEGRDPCSEDFVKKYLQRLVNLGLLRTAKTKTLHHTFYYVTRRGFRFGPWTTFPKKYGKGLN